jgi:hypothetical protein
MQLCIENHTGQKQSSGRAAAELVIELLGAPVRPAGIRMHGSTMEAI